jgi:hydroxymethylbilane synthase
MRIATRGSALAMVQANLVLDACHTRFPEQPFELCLIKTTGDRFQRASLQRFAPAVAQGLFTKELEAALLENTADMAVHSLKDLPTQLPAGLRIGAVLPRADVRDVLITRDRPAMVSSPGEILDLPMESVIATSSPRRSAQLRLHRPDLRWREIRGNVPTRLRKLATGRDFDATLLAAAGLARLGIEIDAAGRLSAPHDLAPDGWGGDLRGTFLPVEIMLPAPGQAAIAIECRRGDQRTIRVCRAMDDPATRACVVAERAFLAGFGGGCHSAVAALARIEGEDHLRLEAIACDNERVWREIAVGPRRGPASFGATLGRRARRALLRVQY